MKNYNIHPSLNQIYTEESYLIDIVEENSTIIFIIDAAIMPASPYYIAPEKEVAHCYKVVKLIFKGVNKHQWITPFKREKILSADSLSDYGAIDLFQCDLNTKY